MLLWLVPVAAAWAGVVFMLLPDTLIPYDDDVGYLRSVVHTLQHGRPWTDAWLEPWAASLGAVTAALVWLTGSFSLGVESVLVVCAVVSVVFAVMLFNRRGASRPGAVLCALVLLSFPTLLWKQTQFTSLALYLPAMLGALLAAERRRWLVFFVAYLVAVTSRQSAIAWLALPAWMATRDLVRSRGEAGSRWRPVMPEIATIVAGLGVYLATGWMMNDTYAQRVMTGAMWSSLDPVQVARGTCLAGIVFCLAAGGGAFLRRCLASHNSADEGFRLRLVPVAAGMSVLVAAWFAPRLAVVELELPLREMMGSWCYAACAVCVAVIGWVWGGWHIRWDYVATGGVAAALVGLRGSLWDYYLLDVAVLGSFTLERCQFAAGGVRVPWRRWVGLACGCAIGLAALVQHHGAALRVKRVMDGSRALTILCERALRAGRIDADELSIAPFGLQVWHLYPCFISTVGSDGQYIAGFMRYLRPGALGLEVSGVPAGSDESVIVPDEGEIIAEGVFRAQWSEHHRFTVRRGSAVGSAELPWDESGWSLRPFPLNDDEWRELVSGPRLE